MSAWLICSQKQKSPPRQFPDVESGRCGIQAFCAWLYFWLIQRTSPSSRMGFQPSASMPCRTSPAWAIINFLKALNSVQTPITDFTPQLWNALVEKGTVNADGGVVFTFRNGGELTE